MNKERMAKVIKDIERFLNDLEEEGIRIISSLENKEKFYAVSMLLFSKALKN